MNTGLMNTDLTLALQLADTADEITRAAFRSQDLVVSTKPDLTPVTDADRKVEEVLRARLADARPADAVLGEEFGSSGPAGGRRWIIDPIDGTKNFVRGVPVWATLIALHDEAGKGLVGVASAPVLGRRWWAARGEGAFADGQPIHVSAIGRLEDAQVSYSSISGWPTPAPLLALAARVWRTRAFGDFWSHLLVAEGAAEVGLDPIVSLWDLAALQVIVEEAGGRFTDLGGAARADGGSAVTTNGLVHDEVLGILNGT
jgi:histidinol-phosphatase